MTLHLTKTDNASIANKVELRKRATAGIKQLRVLDLYAGENVIWNHFDKQKYYGIDIQKGKGRNLTADSKRVVANLDLSQFNVIDCDSYGIPFDVLVKILNNPTLKKGTVIIYTAITNSLSGLNSECLKMYGLNKIYQKCQHLIVAHALDMFYGMLEMYGVSEVFYYSLTGNFTKHYGYFLIEQENKICQ